MKSYHKRLLALVLAAALVLGLSSVFISAVFSVDASQLHIETEGVARSADGLSRSDGVLPSLAQINQDGYDTVLATGFEQVLADEKATLYFNAATAEVALQESGTGHIWYSNPQDRAQETMVEGTTRLRLGAQVTVAYYDARGAYGQMDSYNDCIAYGNMTFESTEKELLVHYRLGKTTVTLADVPQQISKERMDEFIAPLDDASKEDLLGNYRLASITGQDQSYIDKLKVKYPNVENGDVYYLTKDSTRILKKIRAYLDECGYTWDDLDYDNAENGVITEASSRAFFALTLSYRLENGALVATVKGDALDYDAAIPPNEIRILEYFGAGGKTEKGYMLLPDGSGTLIYYNNGKTAETPFAMRLYGEDTVSNTKSAYVADKKASLPVFGIKNGQAALLATVEQGEALCTLCARVAGMQNSYNTAYVSMMATAVDRMTLSDTQQIYFETEPYRGDVTVRYQPLPAEQSSYMGMAQAYRATLLENGTLKAAPGPSYPLAADIICAVPSTDIVAGLPVDSMEAMTSYTEVADMARTLAEVSGTVWLRLEGALSGGMDQGAFKGIYAEGALGGKDALLALVQTAKQEGFCLMPEIYLATAFKQSGFSSSRDCARDLCRDIAVRYYYDYLSRYRRYDGRAIYQLNARKLAEATAALQKDAQKAGMDFALVGDIGNSLYSDFTSSAPQHRVAMQEVQVSALAALHESLSLGVANPNLYALSYADGIYDLPCSDSGFRVTDESVPFYQAVVRGSIDYVSEPLNYADDYRMALLNAVEFGAGLQYTLSWQTTALLKDTDYSYINRGRFADWEETIRQDYARASEVLLPLAGIEITDHSRYQFNVYITTYADGTRVVVNYSADAVQVAGTEVPAYGFAAVKAGDGV